MRIGKLGKLRTYEVIVLFIAMILSLNLMAINNNNMPLQLMLAITFGLIGLADLFKARHIKHKSHENKKERIKYTWLAVIFFIGVPASLIPGERLALRLTFIIYILSIVFSRIMSIAKKRRPLWVTANVIIILAALLCIVAAIIIDDGQVMLLTILISFMIMAKTFTRLIAISMSQIRLDILKRIFINSMATEVFMGLVILIVSCSLMLSSLNGETDINSFGDGLWYCFAIVTTIGFGDITAHTYIGRIISVILGCYGIVVVALITSIIINFYNETKDAKMTDEHEGEEEEESVTADKSK